MEDESYEHKGISEDNMLIGATRLPPEYSESDLSQHDAISNTILEGDVVNTNEVVRRIIEVVQAYFLEHTSHRPSAAMLEGLSDIPRTILSILGNTAEPKIYLSPLDTGVGKSTALAHTIRWLRENKNSNTELDVGVVICLGRYTEIISMIRDMGLDEDEYAVLATKEAEEVDSDGNKIVLADMGVGQDHIDEAPVLFTTHAMVELRLTERTWGEAKAFYYRGKPRKVRVWDESLFIRKGITINKQALHTLAGAVPEFTDQIERFMDDLAAAGDHTILNVPDLASQASLPTVTASLKPEKRRYLGSDLKNLWAISGKRARVRKEGRDGVLVQYEINLPDDIKPILVLDASARVRATYLQQNRVDGDIHLLRDASKKYSNVKVHFERGSSGKGQYGKDYYDRLREIAGIIERHPDRKPLVLHHMPDRAKGIGAIQDDLMAYLIEKPNINAVAKPVGEVPDVAFCHWGVHNATNEFADRDLIITATIFHLPMSLYEARGRAASDRPVRESYNPKELQELRHGEFLHDLLQGLSRGSLRNLEGDQAKDCLIYLRAADLTGVKGALPRLFPGCKVFDGWKLGAKATGIRTELTPKQKEVLEVIDSHFENGAVELSYPEIYNAMGMYQQSFSRLFDSDLIMDELTKMGLQVRDGRPKTILPIDGSNA